MRHQHPRVSQIRFALVLSGVLILAPASIAFLDGADIYIGELAELQQFGRIGDIVGLLGDSPVCNAGTSDLDWLTAPNPNHPFMNFNLYRLKDGRLMQIGQSSAKHALGAAQNNACGFGCSPYPNSDRLGVGCSDTYSAQFNANSQQWMGPRSEINPWTGAWTYNGSYISTPHNHDSIDHRLQVHDDDLDPAQNAGAQYFYECYVLGHDDGDHMNSIAREPVAITSGAPGGTWVFNLSGNNTSLGPAIQSWPGATVTSIPANPVSDGRVFLAYKITVNPNGSTHYEYAIYNHDMDRGIGSFSLPRTVNSIIDTASFSAVFSHDDIYTNDDWSITINSTTLSWATEPFNINPVSNPVRWGTMYNFWFDSNAAAASTTATLGAFKPGTPSQYTGAAQGPVGALRKPGDVNSDNVVNAADLLGVINHWGPCPSPAPGNCPYDVAPAPAGDGVMNAADLLLIINNWG